MKVWPLLALILISASSLAQTPANLPQHLSTWQQQVYQTEPLSAQDQFYFLMATSIAADQSIAEANWLRFSNFIEDIEPKINKARSLAKKAKLLDKYMREVYLKEYRINSNFSDLARKEAYNSYTATALYLLAFEMLGLPGLAYEEPSRAYPRLDVGPDSRYIFSSVTEYYEYTQYDGAFKNLYLEWLDRQPNYSPTKGANRNETFDASFFQTKPLSLKEVASLIVLNQAFNFQNAPPLSERSAALELAHYLSPGARTAFMLWQNQYQKIAEAGTRPDQVFPLLVELKQLNPADTIADEDIYNTVASSRYEYFSNQKDPQLFEKAYQELIVELPDGSLKQRLAHGYHYEKARVLAQNLKLDAALDQVKIAYELNGDADTKSFLVNLVLMRSSKYSDILQASELIMEYAERYPELMSVNAFKAAVLQANLLQAAKAYQNNQPSQGSRLLETFEAGYRALDEDIKETAINEHLIGRAYSLAAVYYFKRGSSGQARQVLERGLTYAPNSNELKQRLNMMR